VGEVTANSSIAHIKFRYIQVYFHWVNGLYHVVVLGMGRTDDYFFGKFNALLGCASQLLTD
jgi:hypothetical protein